jgi:hypothetical protein
MDLKDYMAISGKPGLFKFISQGRNNMIVENLETGLRTSAFKTEKVLALADIAVFTADDEVPLKEVLRSVYEKEDGGHSISHKSSPDELKTWFTSILPDYDRDRVYVSDIKKIVQWYNILQQLDLLDFSEEDQDEVGEDQDDETTKAKEKEGSDGPKASPEKKQKESTSKTSGKQSKK